MSAVRTWADGFGRWYAEVPEGQGGREVARRAIEHELDIRGENHSGYVVTVERCDEATYGPDVYREVVD